LREYHLDSPRSVPSGATTPTDLPSSSGTITPNSALNNQDIWTRRLTGKRISDSLIK